MTQTRRGDDPEAERPRGSSGSNEPASKATTGPETGPNHAISGESTPRSDAEDTKSEDDDESAFSAARQRYEVWRESIRRRPNIDRAYRIGVGLLGGAIVVGGLALVPLPGPGWLIVFVGLAILATEFEWAERVEKFARRQVSKWTHWLGRQPIWVRALVGLATFAFVLAVVYCVLRFMTGVPSWIPDAWVDWIPGLTP